MLAKVDVLLMNYKRLAQDFAPGHIVHNVLT